MLKEEKQRLWRYWRDSTGSSCQPKLQQKRKPMQNVTQISTYTVVETRSIMLDFNVENIYLPKQIYLQTNKLVLWFSKTS